MPNIEGISKDYLFPGVEGVPFRSDTKEPPLLAKNEEGEVPELVETVDAGIRIFKTWIPEDLKSYSEIWDMIAKGNYVLSDESKEYVPEHVGWVIFLRFGRRIIELKKRHLQRTMDYYQQSMGSDANHLTAIRTKLETGDIQ